MKEKIVMLFCLLSLSTMLVAQERKVPIPSESQLQWQDAELAVLISYDLHVSDGKRYNQAYNRITPIPDVNIFNPKHLDTDQWIRSVKGMGAKIAILTATHETGFALYQSDVNSYCMKALKFQNGKGDIVRDFVNSCRKYGVKPGIYIGIRWNSFLGVYDFLTPQDGTVFTKNRQASYNKMCEGMTRELMSRYGDLAMVWYDGGGHGPELGGADVLSIVEKYQKNIIFYHNTQRADIRWGGSESGTVPYPCWGTYPYCYSHSKNQKVIYKDNFSLLKTGDPEGNYYMPAMSDVPLRAFNGRHEWFWEPGDEKHILPVKNLMDMYRKSVGRNTTLILGITPNADGVIPKVDADTLSAFGSKINAVFSHPLKTVSSLDGKKKITVRFKKMTEVKEIVIEEDISQGERIRSYSIEAKRNGKWFSIVNGTCIGHKRIEEISPIETTEIRLIIKKSIGKPRIKQLIFY